MLFERPVAVVIPAYRERERVARTIAAVPSFVDHVVVVDDGSDDGTDEAARGACGGRAVVLRHERNRGVGAAIVTGYREASRLGARAVAVMAGDAQMDAADLPSVLGPVVEGRADYVKGNRLVHADAHKMPHLRRVGTAALGALTGLAIGARGISDSQCGYTAISAEFIDRLPLERLYPRYGYPNDLLSQVALSGGRIVEVTVRPVYAGERSGLRPWHVAVMLGLIARAAARRKLSGAGRRAM